MYTYIMNLLLVSLLSFHYPSYTEVVYIYTTHSYCKKDRQRDSSCPKTIAVPTLHVSQSTRICPC